MYLTAPHITETSQGSGYPTCWQIKKLKATFSFWSIQRGTLLKIYFVSSQSLEVSWIALLAPHSINRSSVGAGKLKTENVFGQYG